MLLGALQREGCADPLASGIRVDDSQSTDMLAVGILLAPVSCEDSRAGTLVAVLHPADQVLGATATLADLEPPDGLRRFAGYRVQAGEAVAYKSQLEWQRAWTSEVSSLAQQIAPTHPRGALARVQVEGTEPGQGTPSATEFEECGNCMATNVTRQVEEMDEEEQARFRTREGEKPLYCENFAHFGTAPIYMAIPAHPEKCSAPTRIYVDTQNQENCANGADEGGDPLKGDYPAGTCPMPCHDDDECAGLEYTFELWDRDAGYFTITDVFDGLCEENPRNDTIACCAWYDHDGDATFTRSCRTP